MEKQIIALGGGGFSMEPDNPLLDRYIIKQTGKRKPKVCFVATASGDAEAYILKFYTSFIKLNCIPAHLSLFNPATKDMEDFILGQDVIYVGGGNTRSMIALWKEWGVDAFFRAAWENGTVLAGISAGSLCWFEEGLSDFLPGQLNRLKCLGFLPGSNCPHYDGESERQPTYHRLISKGEISEGIAADDGAALHYVGQSLANIVSSRRSAKAYSVKRNGDKIEERALKTVYLGL
jgi:dipeptidase E